MLDALSNGALPGDFEYRAGRVVPVAPMNSA